MLSWACEIHIFSHVRLDERFWSQTYESHVIKSVDLSLYVHAGYIMRLPRLYTVSQRITSPLPLAEASNISPYTFLMRLQAIDAFIVRHALVLSLLSLKRGDEVKS